MKDLVEWTVLYGVIEENEARSILREVYPQAKKVGCTLRDITEVIAHATQRGMNPSAVREGLLTLVAGFADPKAKALDPESICRTGLFRTLRWMKAADNASFDNKARTGGHCVLPVRRSGLGVETRYRSSVPFIGRPRYTLTMLYETKPSSYPQVDLVRLSNGFWQAVQFDGFGGVLSAMRRHRWQITSLLESGGGFLTMETADHFRPGKKRR